VKRLLFVPLIALSGVLFSQETVQLYNNNQVSISYRNQDCNDTKNGIYKQNALLKFTNKTAHTISVSFSRELEYNGKPQSPDTKVFTVVLKPNQTLEGACQETNNALSVFVKFLDKVSNKQLTRFAITDVKITE
jgi:hypothetical protein